MQQKRAEKIPVIIASGLKPVKDIRAFGKLGLSMSETNKYSLNFIGFSPKRSLKSGGIRYFSSITDTKSLWQRVCMPLRFAQIVFKLKPQLVICCTWEYLPLARFLKLFLGFRLIYDVQENYLSNLDLNPERSWLSKSLARMMIKLSESTGGIDHYTLAESCYKSEMPAKQPATVLPNLFQGKRGDFKIVQLAKKNQIQLLITGTLSPAFGTENALIWFQKSSEIYPQIQLRIVGHCPLMSFEKKLKKLVKNQEKIFINISRNPLPYHEILEEMKSSDLVLLPYENRPQFRDKMPTKLYECAALNIPILHSPNPVWEKFLAPFQGGVSIDFLDLDHVEEQLSFILDQSFFTNTPSENIYWDSVKDVFLASL